MVADCGLAADMHRVATELKEKEAAWAGANYLVLSLRSTNKWVGMRTKVQCQAYLSSTFAGGGH